MPLKRKQRPAGDPVRQFHAAMVRLCFAAFVFLPLAGLGVLFVANGIGMEATPGSIARRTQINPNPLPPNVLEEMRTRPPQAPALAFEPLASIDLVTECDDFCFVPAAEPGGLPRLAVLTGSSLILAGKDGPPVTHPFGKGMDWADRPCLQAFQLGGEWRLVAMAGPPNRVVCLDLQGRLLWETPMEHFVSAQPRFPGWGQYSPGVMLQVGHDRGGEPLLLVSSSTEHGVECLGPDGAFRWRHVVAEVDGGLKVRLLWCPAPEPWEQEIVLVREDGLRFTLPADGSSAPRLVVDAEELTGLMRQPWIVPTPLALLLWPGPGMYGSLEALREGTGTAAPDTTVAQRMVTASQMEARRWPSWGTVNSFPFQLVDDSGREVGQFTLLFSGIHQVTRKSAAGGAQPAATGLEADLDKRRVRLGGAEGCFEFREGAEGPELMVEPSATLTEARVFLLPGGRALLAVSGIAPARVLLLRVGVPLEVAP